MFFGWWIVGTTFLIAIWGWGLGFYGLSIYLVALQHQNSWAASTVSFAITGYYLIGALLVTALSDVMRRWGPTPTVLTGIFAMGSGVYGLTWVTEPWQMHLAFALMAVGWCTMSSASINILLAPWFERRRGIAVSLALTGATCGGMVVAPLLLALIGTFGFHVGVGAAVLMMMATLVPPIVVTLRHTPASLGVRPDGETGQVSTLPNPPASHLRPPAEIRSARAEALRSGKYWTISLAFALALAAQVGVLTHFIAYLAPLHGTATAAAALSVTTLSALVARFAVGALVDRINRRALSAGVFVTQALGLILLLVRQSPLALYAGCLFFGFGVGNLITLPGLLIQREFRNDHFAAVVSLMVATNQIAFAFSPSILGVLRDATGTYDAALSFCIALELAGAAIILGGGRLGRRAAAAAVSTTSHGADASSPSAPALSGDPMLQLRPNCECCDRDLPADSQEAVICSFECTFCRTCADTILGGKCPNCTGELVRRPVRPSAALAKYPASTQRVVRRDPCAKVA